MSHPSATRSATLLQHAGRDARLGSGLVGALEQSVTFATTRVDDMPIYARLSNTTNHVEVCALVAALHGAPAARVFASGMAAIHAVLTTRLRPGDHILVQENCYGTSQGLCQKILSRWGIEASFVPLEQWQAALRPNTRVLFFESISNPYCIPQNLAFALEAKRVSSGLLVCDNTFASPINCKPFLHGVDVVVESATKYMNGHSDLICGAVACGSDFAQELAVTAMYVGGFLSSAGCMHLAKGLRTLQVRMAAHNANGRAFASAVRELPDVSEVYHGSLCAMQDDWIKDFAGMVTVRFAKHIDVSRLMRSLNLVADVPSLGGTETTACLPWWTTNRWMADSEKQRLKIDEQLVRFSIGLEDVNDLLDDLKQGLALARR